MEVVLHHLEEARVLGVRNVLQPVRNGPAARPGGGGVEGGGDQPGAGPCQGAQHGRRDLGETRYQTIKKEIVQILAVLTVTCD